MIRLHGRARVKLALCPSYNISLTFCNKVKDEIKITISDRLVQDKRRTTTEIYHNVDIIKPLFTLLLGQLSSKIADQALNGRNGCPLTERNLLNNLQFKYGLMVIFHAFRVFPIPFLSACF